MTVQELADTLGKVALALGWAIIYTLIVAILCYAVRPRKRR